MNSEKGNIISEKSLSFSSIVLPLEKKNFEGIRKIYEFF